MLVFCISLDRELLLFGQPQPQRDDHAAGESSVSNISIQLLLSRSNLLVIIWETGTTSIIVLCPTLFKEELK